MNTQLINSSSNTTTARPAAMTAQVVSEPGLDAPLQDRFEHSFYYEYQPRFCGRNIDNFVSEHLTPEERAGAKVIAIENSGGWFGLVRAMKARDCRADGTPMENDRNWQHHVVLETGGQIYDFDFGIKPRPLPVEHDFNEMYLTKDKNVKPADKLDGYLLKVVDAEEYTKGDISKVPQVKLQDYLSSWGANLKTFTTT